MDFLLCVNESMSVVDYSSEEGHFHHVWCSLSLLSRCMTQILPKFWLLSNQPQSMDSNKKCPPRQKRKGKKSVIFCVFCQRFCSVCLHLLRISSSPFMFSCPPSLSLNLSHAPYSQGIPGGVGITSLSFPFSFFNVSSLHANYISTIHAI